MRVDDRSPLGATIAAYDATAVLYAAAIGTEITAEIEAPLDRALLEAFVELVAPSGGLIADIGCGPGRVAAFLTARGVHVLGVDPSAGMLAVAETAHPTLRFEIGHLTEIPVADSSLAGAACWYSIIHTPPAGLADAFRELGRVLAPGASLLIAFQAGHGEGLHRDSVQGIEVSLSSYRHDPDEVAVQLGEAGLLVHTRASRDPVGAHESTPQAFLIARRSLRTNPQFGAEVS